VAAALTLCALTAPARALEGPAERDVALLGEPAGPPLAGIELDLATEQVASRMRCPVCQGLSVADSHTDSAQAMRTKARELLSRGYSHEQVLTYFESSYGEFIRLSPRPEGFNLVVWMLPVAGLLVGAALIWARLRRRAAPAGRETPAPERDDDLSAYRERVRRETSGRSPAAGPGERKPEAGGPAPEAGR
jgi:cytochrome c-type biogenesis protein CcmH